MIERMHSVIERKKKTNGMSFSGHVETTHRYGLITSMNKLDGPEKLVIHLLHKGIAVHSARAQGPAVRKPDGVDRTEKEEAVPGDGQGPCIETLALKNDPKPFVLKLHVMRFIDQDIPADVAEQRAFGGIVQGLVKDLCSTFDDQYRDGPYFHAGVKSADIAKQRISPVG